MYKEDLLWVWREQGASIIRTNRDPPATLTITTYLCTLRSLIIVSPLHNPNPNWYQVYMKSTCYEYEVCGVQKSYPTSCYKWETEWITYCHCDCVPKHIAIAGWGWIHMTTSHCRRCWNTIYMYEVNLLKVWSGWGASIIIYRMIQIQVRNQEILLLPSTIQHTTTVISGWHCILITHNHKPL
jgi:hypothetical protein